MKSNRANGKKIKSRSSRISPLPPQTLRAPLSSHSTESSGFSDSPEVSSSQPILTPCPSYRHNLFGYLLFVISPDANCLAIARTRCSARITAAQRTAICHPLSSEDRKIGRYFPISASDPPLHGELGSDIIHREKVSLFGNLERTAPNPVPPNCERLLVSCWEILTAMSRGCSLGYGRAYRYVSPVEMRI
jgi:hypothetical protein